MLPQTGERQVAESIEGIKPNHRERYQFAINQIHAKYGDEKITILDAACGVGYGTWMIAKSLPNAVVVGADIYEGAVEAANRAYKLDNNSFIQLDLGNAEQWNEKIGVTKFDAVVSIETIEHVEDDSSLLERYAQITDFLVGSVPNQDVVPFEPKTHPFHFRHYTQYEFHALLRNAGFEPQEMHCQYNKIPGFVYEGDDGMGFICAATK